MNRYLDNELSYLSVDVEKTKSFFSYPQPVRVSQLCQGNPPTKKPPRFIPWHICIFFKHKE